MDELALPAVTRLMTTTVSTPDPDHNPLLRLELQDVGDHATDVVGAA